MSERNLTAIITGASRGLGRAIADAYARRGIRLVLTARDADALSAAASGLQEFTDVWAVAGDVGVEHHRQRLVADAVQRFGGIDILINNASELGPSPMPSLAALSVEDYARILDIDAIAPLRLTQLALPALQRSGSGIIINISSDAAVNAYAGWGGYGSAKAALEHWSRILAQELEGTPVRIFVVDPGDMRTRMHELAEPGVDLSHLPLPEAVAPAFVRLLEDRSAFARLEARALLASGSGVA